MTTPKHTPEPWEIARDRHPYRIMGPLRPHAQARTTGPADLMTRTAVCLLKYPSQQEHDANARLIAAAPEMYRLLSGVFKAQPSYFYDEVRALLARIDGEET